MTIAQSLRSALMTRPAWENRNLGNETLWIADNSEALARFWQELGRALGIDDEDGKEDLDFFLREQHRQAMREPPRLHVRACVMSPEERAKKVAEAIANIGNPSIPRTMYQPPKLSEHEVEELHRQEMARRLK